MSASQNTAGRKVTPIVAANFTFVRDVPNKSGRKIFSCNHCGMEIENRDNRAVKHISDLKTCSRTPPGVRQQALVVLSGKLVNEDTIFTATNPQPEQGSSTTAAGSTDQDQQQLSMTGVSSTEVVPRKRHGQTLAGLVDFALTERQKGLADVNLFWYVCTQFMCNVIS
jgi:hypothetical protein